MEEDTARVGTSVTRPITPPVPPSLEAPVEGPGEGPGEGPTGPPAGRPAEQPADRSATGPVEAVRAGLLVGGTYLALAVGIYWHVWSTHPTTVSQPGGDQFSNMWFLSWLPFALGHLHNPFFSDFANFPFGINLLTNTSSLFLGTLFAPVTVLFGPVASFNTVSTVALAASAGAGYVFVRTWTEWRPAAFVGGLLYGFGPYAIAQSAGHINLTFTVFPPLILLCAHRILVVQRGRARTWGIALALLVTAQFFVSTEVLASTFVVAGIGVVVVACMGRHRVRAHVGYALRAAGWALGLGVVLLAYPVWFAVAGPAHLSGPIQLVPQGYRADLAGLVLPDANQRFAPTEFSRMAADFANSITENGSYLGVTLLLILVVGTILLWRRAPVVRVASIVGLSALVLSLGGGLVVTGRPGGFDTGFPLPERLFTKLPLLSNTIPARYALFVTLFAALLLGVILDRLHRRLRGAPRRQHSRHDHSFAGSRVRAVVLPLLVAAVALVPLWPAVPFTSVGPLGFPAYFTSSAVSRIPSGSVALVYPYSTSPTPDAQGWQAVGGLRFRMPGGYFLVPDGPDHRVAFSPLLGYTRDTLTAQILHALYLGAPPPLTPTLRASLLVQWRAWHVDSVVAVPGGGADPAAAIAYLSALLDRPPRPQGGGTWAWYGVRAQLASLGSGGASAGSPASSRQG